MFLSHRAWRHAYATAYWQQACSQRHSSGNGSEAQKDKLRHAMFSWSSGPMFGVRRPLRHLAWKLNLDEDQVRKLVDILDKLKTGYAQARLDRDRSTSDVAAVFSAAEFDTDRASAAFSMRTRATETLNQELLTAIRALFEMLNEEQRKEFAYLLRSGAFML
jgi:Spy/CpxP family protein refolding chaperone